MTDETDVWVPFPMAGYEDWSECLGAWLVELAPDPMWSFEPWAHLYGLLRGSDEGYSRPLTSRDFDHSSAASQLFGQWRRGILAPHEFLRREDLWTAALDHLWAGLSVHRAAGDWLAHLAYAATLDSSWVRPTFELLLHHYYASCGNDRIQALWRLNPDDPGATFGAADHREHAHRLWDFAREDEFDAAEFDQPDDAARARFDARRAVDPAFGAQISRHGYLGFGPYANEFVAAPSLISYRGEPLVGKDVVEAADTVLHMGGWPALVATLEPCSHRALLQPQEIDHRSRRVVAIEIVTGDTVVLTPLANTATGWLVRRADWL
jgi:hypothetical protein